MNKFGRKVNVKLIAILALFKLAVLYWNAFLNKSDNITHHLICTSHLMFSNDLLLDIYFV